MKTSVPKLTVPQVRLAPSGSLSRTASRASKVSVTAAANGAQWVDTPSYSLNGWLGYYGRIAHDPLPVVETNAPFRYQYMPPMDEALAAAPHLSIDPATPPPGAIDLGTITRDYAGAPLATYRVYLVK